MDEPGRGDRKTPTYGGLEDPTSATDACEAPHGENIAPSQVESPEPWTEPRDAQSTCTTPSPRSTVFVFGLVCLAAVAGSGGLIIGVGPFMEAMVRDGHFASACEGQSRGCPAQYDAMSPIYNGGFIMMTFASCAAGLLLAVWGPRVNAALGMVTLTVGCHLLSTATDADGVAWWTFGYGLVGSGGNFLYISSFHFANLFARRGVAIGLLGGLFNLSGLVFLLLNVPGLTVSLFFRIYTIIGVVLLVCALIIYPDAPYIHRRGHHQTPTLCARSPRLQGWRSRCGQALLCCRRAEVREAVSTPRFVGFTLLFGVTTMTNVVVGGLITTLATTKRGASPARVDFFNGYAYPLVGNSTFLFTPLVGLLVQQSGFWPCMAGLVLSAASCIILCWTTTLDSLYVMLLFFNLTQAFAYTLEFAYIQMTYAPGLYGPLVATTIAVQAIIGLVAWPGLSPNPFGATDFTPVLLICLLPTLLLAVVPYRQYVLERAALESRPTADDEGAELGAESREPTPRRKSSVASERLYLVAGQ